MNNKKNLNDSFNNAFKIKDNIHFEFMKNDNRQYPPRLVPKGINSDRSNTVVITKKMYDLKYKPTKPLKTLDQDVMSPNSTIT